jgi:sirohydrochlorin cobaltochelatase
MADEGLLLFAHGARDPRWAAPFEAVVARIRATRPDLPVVLAFLEHAAPDLRDALLQMRSKGCRKVRIVPLFFGRGGHLRDDFPRVLDDASRSVPDVMIDVTLAAGESDAVQAALAAFALAHVDATSHDERVP